MQAVEGGGGIGRLRAAADQVGADLSQVEQVRAGGGVTPTFGVTDIEAAKAALDEHGIRQDGPIRDVAGMVRLLTFFDPDENALMFYQAVNEA